MSDFEAKLEQCPVLPVLVVENIKDARPLGEALLRGGIPFAEVTMRTECALDAIREMNKLDGLTVGAGTVLSGSQAKAALDAGASFIVAPGLDEATVLCCKNEGATIYPGVATAGEIQKAWNLGLRIVKFFPANLAGGPKAIKSFASVFRDMKFIPTGGVSLDNLGDYLAERSVIACGGSWLAPSDLVQAGAFGEIEKKVRECVQAIEKIRGDK